MPRKAKDKEELIEEKEIKKRTKKSTANTDDIISTKKKTTNTMTKKTNSTEKSTVSRNSSTKAKTSTKGKKANSAEKSTTTKKKSTKSTESTASTTAVKSAKNKKLKKSVVEDDSIIPKKTTRKRKSPTKKDDFLVEYYDLPYKYNKTVIKLLAQTPETLFVYWEISDDDRNHFIEKYGENFFETSIPILKIHNKTKNYTFEVEINDFANCWYLHVNDSKCDYQIELDRKLKNNWSNSEYVYVSSSNDIESPNDHILFEQNLSTVQFKNVKTNEIKDIDITKNIEKIYNIENLYKLFYTEEDLKNIKNLSNPSSSDPTSTFK